MASVLLEGVTGPGLGLWANKGAAQSEQQIAAPTPHFEFDRKKVVIDIAYLPHMIESNSRTALIVQEMERARIRRGFAQHAVIGYNLGPDYVRAISHLCLRVQRRVRIGNAAHDAPTGYRRQQ